MTIRQKKINQNQKFRKIYFQIFLYILIVTAFTIHNAGFEISFTVLALLSFLLLVITLFLLFFFSQFALPVLDLNQRINGLKRLLLYILDDHGPAYFIENGELRERKIDRLKKGPGVVILDTASAAVIRTPVKFKNAIGPGIAFTERNDVIAGIVDLQIQTQSIGPRQEENPFAHIQKTESPAAYEARMKRRNESLAITRDGIQLCVNFSIRFKLDANPGEGNSAFGFNARAAEKAIIGQSIDIEKSADNPNRSVSWKSLPAHLVMDIFREYISKFTLNELFPLYKTEINIIDLISNQTKLRLTQSAYFPFDNYGNQLKENLLSKEFELLKNRGIRMLDVSITNIRLPLQIEEELQTRWKTSWLDVANKERSFVEQEHALQALDGQNQGLMDYAYGASKYLGSIQDNLKLNQKEILIALLQGNLDTIAQTPDLSAVLKNEYKDISDLIEWVRYQGDKP